MKRVLTFLLLVITLCFLGTGNASASDDVVEFPIDWPNKAIDESGSSHEITYDHHGGKDLWITGQNYDHIARVTLDGDAQLFAMPEGSGPHGIEFDTDGHLWVSFEFEGSVAQIDPHGKIVETIDVKLHADGAKAPINTHPHGLGLGADGHTLWFTGKKTNTIGKINSHGLVEHFELPTVGAVPIYLATGPDGNIWCTELVGNQIARITPTGEVDEFPIPTHNSRPIAIVPGPALTFAPGLDLNFMWFSEEAGGKVARVDMDGHITEFPVPLPEKNIILAGMAFDKQGNLWTHAYVDEYNPSPKGPDYIVKFDAAINTVAPEDISQVPVTYYQVPSRNTIMHRITQGPDDNIWFTELGIDKLGKLTVN